MPRPKLQLDCRRHFTRRKLAVVMDRFDLDASAKTSVGFSRRIIGLTIAPARTLLYQTTKEMDRCYYTEDE
jgi:hypothetical protein